MIITDRLADITLRLERSGSLSPRLDAELIVCRTLAMERHALITERDRAITPEEDEGIESLVARRTLGEPVAYLTGTREFYSLDFSVNRSVLIPRPETELLVDLAVYYAPRGGEVADIGTGSGAIAVALKRNRGDVRVTATDISAAALKVARANAARLLGTGEIHFVKGDLYEPLRGRYFDLIVSNPPYVSPAEMAHLQRDLAFEPREALVAEDDGFQVIARVIEGAPAHLEPGGMLILETGSAHSVRVKETGAAHGFEVSVMNDYGGLPRVAVCKIPK
ncbi:MAG: peptide chain release factor N(5)-glutamine methyltransferase [Spirochaetes bacterium]|nr:MAG: peptide chain release factor N(5)-glutamine methyltransferase [Spirochaetota bacterium]